MRRDVARATHAVTLRKKHSWVDVVEQACRHAEWHTTDYVLETLRLNRASEKEIIANRVMYAV